MTQPGHFQGALTALVTPFTSSGAVDWPRLTALLERQLSGGINGLVPCGTTGEAPTLSAEEQQKITALTVEVADGRVPVLAGIGSNNTAAAIDNAKRARDAGAQGVLATAPYYNKPTQAGLVAHFAAIADAADGVEVCVYDVPGRSAVRLSRQTLLTCAEHPNITAIKDATGDLVHAAALASQLPDGVSLLSGDDPTLFPFVCLGGHGSISVTSNVLPRRWTALVAAARAGRLAEARQEHHRLLPLMEGLFLQTNPLPTKALLSVLGHCEDRFRLPLVPMDPGPRADLLAIWEALGLSEG